MRRHCDWFADRAKVIWNAKPGRSMLVMVPQGCDEASSARLIRQWLDEHFRLPTAYSNHRPVIIRLVSDGLESSAQFAHIVRKKIEKGAQVEVEIDAQDFSTDILQNSVEAAIEAGAYPILMIERFHAFANIRDGGMASMLSRLRSIESDGQMTTLAFSPIGYDAIRRLMHSEQPFLNSVYGDMHDEAIMSPLDQADFLAEASSRGIDQPTAHRLFTLGGGPDALFLGLLDLASCDRASLIGQCAARTGSAIDLFLARALPQGLETDQLLVNLALGRVNPAQEAALLSHPLAKFLCKRNATDVLICASPVIARQILTRHLSISAQYDRCLQALEASDFTEAATKAAALDDPHPRLAAFRELVIMRGALVAVPGRGLLGIDWQAVADASRRLRKLDGARLDAVRPWLEVIDEAAGRILAGKPSRLQADMFTRHASDGTLRLLLLFMMSALADAAARLSEPAQRVQALVNLPEAILQTLAAGFCGIDYAEPPASPPPAEYGLFFNGHGLFVFPPPTTKMTLGALLVVVPAILAQRAQAVPGQLTDAASIRPLQQKLVDAVRNPASHTIANFSSRDAALLEGLCRTWIEEWCVLEGLASAAALPILHLAPTAGQLAAMLTE